LIGWSIGRSNYTGYQSRGRVRAGASKPVRDVGFDELNNQLINRSTEDLINR